MTAQATAVDSVRQIVGWVQENVQEQWQKCTRRPSSVCKSGIGDPTQKITLAVLLCRAAGYPAEYGVAKKLSQRQYKPGELFKDDLQGHVLVVHLDGRDWIGFPNLEGLEFGCVPSDYLGCVAFSLHEPGISGLMKGEDAEHALIEQETELTLAEDGRCGVIETNTVHGFQAWRIRGLFKKLVEALASREDSLVAAKELNEAMMNLANDQEQEFEGFVYTTIDSDSTSGEKGIRLSYTIDARLHFAPEEVIFNVQGLLTPRTGARYRIDPELRLEDIEVREQEYNIRRVVIHYPKEWELDRSPFHDFERNNVFGSLLAKYTFAPGRFELLQEQHLLPIHRDREVYRDFLRIKLGKDSFETPAQTFLY